MSHIFPRHSRQSFPVAVGGEGCYLIDSTGKRYLDGSGGAAVSCLGHGDAEITAAIKSQLDAVAFALIWTALVIFTTDSIMGERKARRLARAANLAE